MSISVLIEAELEAMKRIEEAKKRAEKIIEEAKKEAERIKDINVILGRVSKYVEEEEKKIKEEAKKLYNEYLKKTEKIKAIPLSKLEEIANKIVMEVLGLE